MGDPLQLALLWSLSYTKPRLLIRPVVLHRLEPPGAKVMARAGLGWSVDHHFARVHHHKKGTPDAPSISSAHSMTASMSITDSEPLGSNVGKRSRGPLRMKSESLLVSGIVFGRDLKNVKETGDTVAVSLPYADPIVMTVDQCYLYDTGKGAPGSKKTTQGRFFC